ncbi:MAG: ribbon-helix-helix domain-containing protein, partial [Dysosmobacter sp.]|nr:ribbon-helix-helix domain-containing protein [Dysosmobacter sp.]
MKENQEKRSERTVVWLDSRLISRMDGWLEADNCKNRSEFINKALRFYMGYLGSE